MIEIIDKQLTKIVNLLKSNAFMYIKGDMIISPLVNNSGGYIDVIYLDTDHHCEGCIINSAIDDTIFVEDNIKNISIDILDLVNRSFNLINVKNERSLVYTFNDQEYIHTIMDPYIYTETLSKIGPYKIFLNKFLFKKLNKNDDGIINLYIENEYALIVEIIINKIKDKIQIHRIMRCLRT